MRKDMWRTWFMVVLLLVSAIVLACSEAENLGGPVADGDGADGDAEPITDGDAEPDSDMSADGDHDLETDGETTPLCVMRAGAAKVDITPEIEPFEDLNGSKKWDEGEPYTDTNDNGQYDGRIIAGYSANREATAIHDPLWTRCMALEVNGETFLFCASDIVSFGMERYYQVAEIISGARPELVVDEAHLHWASTHTHQGPDTLGLWGENSMQSGVDPEYISKVVDLTAEAALAALDNLEPATLRFATGEQPHDLVQDIDPPEVFDYEIGIVQALNATGGAIATLMSVANHPEAAGGDLTLMGSDFPHYLREDVEAAQGGMAIYYSGALGLMQSPNTESWDDVERIGKAYAVAINEALQTAGEGACMPVSAVTTKKQVQISNFEFFVGFVNGIIDGFEGHWYREDSGPCSEFCCGDIPISVLRFGDRMTWITMPGEITPELVVGEYPDPVPPGGENADREREPYLEQWITTEHRFIAGLCNLEVGYIFPYYQSDVNNHFSQIHSAGPNVAGALLEGYAELFELLEQNGE